jgi:hypothetical protein
LQGIRLHPLFDPYGHGVVGLPGCTGPKKFNLETIVMRLQYPPSADEVNREKMLSKVFQGGVPTLAVMIDMTDYDRVKPVKTCKNLKPNTDLQISRCLQISRPWLGVRKNGSPSVSV